MKSIITFFLVFAAYSMHAQIPAPDFTVTDTEGNDHTLYADYLDQGTTMVIKMFFVDCPPCNSVAPSVQALYEDWGEGQFDVEFMEVTIRQSDNDAKVQGFKNTHSLTFPGISADGGAIEVFDTLASGNWGPFFGTPSFYVIHPDGTVVSGLNFAGVNGAIESSGATGDGGGTVLTTGFNVSVREAADPSNMLSNVEYFIGDSENLNGTLLPVDLSSYDNVEALIDAFPNINNPSIIFQKNDQHLTNVSTIDISFISKHILGIEIFQEDYKVIASDINGDGSVSALDLGTLTKVVLGLEPFPADSWIFDPPFVELSLDPGNTINLNSEGIKIGNVN